jgi:N-acetylated-alpha-linked acidic dipeptidase
MLLRLANAQVLPYDYAEFARTMRRYVAPVERGLAQKGWNVAAVAPLAAAIARLEASATAFASTRDAALDRAVAPAAQAAANRALLSVERALARPSGLKSRPWYRSLIYASDVDNGYSTMSFPGVNEAIRYGTQAETVAEITDLAARFGAAADAVDAARAALSAPASR